MDYRKLGKTNLEVSILGLGCAAFGGVYGEIGEAEAAHAIEEAFQLGINYLDTAPLYGVTRSETVVGLALRGVPRGRYILSSKVGRYDESDHDFSYDRVRRELDRSLSRLHVDYLDIAILHDIEFAPLSQVVGDGYRALLDARAEGLVRYIGASGLPLAIYPAILAHAELDVVISYAHYTLQNTALESLFPLFERHNLGVINASPLGLGLLSPHGPRDWHLAPAAIKDRCRDAAEWCAARGIDIAELAMRFALAQPRIHSTLTGARNASEVRRNAGYLNHPPDPTLVEAVQQILAPVRNTTWPSGQPAYR